MVYVKKSLKCKEETPRKTRKEKKNKIKAVLCKLMCF